MKILGLKTPALALVTIGCDGKGGGEGGEAGKEGDGEFEMSGDEVTDGKERSGRGEDVLDTVGVAG